MKQKFLPVIAALFVCGVAHGADLPAAAPVYKAAPVSNDWGGYFIGGHVGYGWATSPTDLVSTDPILFTPAQRDGVLPTSLKPHLSGFAGGAQLGYNWQLNHVLVGWETDIAFTAMKGDAVLAVPQTFPYSPMASTQSNKITWLGTLRPRVGWLWTPSTLVYASGGLAYGGTKAQTNVTVDPVGTCPANNGFCSDGSTSKTRVGWAVGAGLETFVASDWTTRIDYLYFDLGHEAYPVISTANFGLGGTEVMHPNASFSGHLVRVGLDYHFH